MASKWIVQGMLMATSVLVAVMVFILSQGIEARITPGDIKAKVNARLPMEFSILSNADVQLDRVRQQTQKKTCRSAENQTNIRCHYRNAFVSPIRKAAGILPVLLHALLERRSNTISVDASIQKIRGLRFSDDGDVHAHSAIEVWDLEFPVDVHLKSEIDAERGVIRIYSDPSQNSYDFLEKWKGVLNVDLGVIEIPIKISDARLRAMGKEIESEPSHEYEIDLKKESLWFSFLRPFLDGIEMDSRAITISYSL